MLAKIDFWLDVPDIEWVYSFSRGTTEEKIKLLAGLADDKWSLSELKAKDDTKGD